MPQSKFCSFYNAFPIIIVKEGLFSIVSVTEWGPFNKRRPTYSELDSVSMILVMTLFVKRWTG